jgi:superfamily I DNA and RNA helicase
MTAGSVTIVRGTNNKPVASDALAKLFDDRVDLQGHLFIGYPIVGGIDGKYPIDALFVSPDSGVVVFDLLDGTDLGDYEERQDDAATKLEARFLANRELVKKRKLAVPILTLTYAPAIPTRTLAVNGDYPVGNSETLLSYLPEDSWGEDDAHLYERTLSALQNISTIRRSRNARRIESPTSRGAKLKSLEESIATLDSLQSKAVIETVEGVQRVRGLAGSGKTIVLALKAAYLHAQHPEWRIAVTFNTRSLRSQFERLINNFFIEQTGEEPNWDNLRILQAWGAGGGGNREGIYHEFCQHNTIQYMDFGLAKQNYGASMAFQGVCDAALKAAVRPKAFYDAILIDEAQDFPPEFLRLCYTSLKKPRRLVYAYDELQNLSGTGLPSSADIFGLDKEGAPLVTFEQDSSESEPHRDIMLEKCYRNSRPVLVTAHALGFGVYRKPEAPKQTGLVQMFDQAALWTDIGYRVKSGSLDPGKNVVLQRTPDTSPRFLEDHSPLDDLVLFKRFDSAREQAEWLAKEIVTNLTDDELRHDDIVVINTNPFTTRKNLGPVRKALMDLGVMSHIAGVDTGPDVFFQHDTDSITFTGIYRAKGNEAGMVYIVDAHESIGSAASLASVRNRLFTAITRSKSWVRVLGVGDEMQKLIDEYESVKAASFELRFKYPTIRQLEQLQIVHRDMSEDEKKAVDGRRQSLSLLVEDLQAGRIFLEDLDADAISKLAAIINNANE